MRTDSPLYALSFALAVGVVCATVVATASVLLHERQEANARLYMHKNVLLATGLIQAGQRLTDTQIHELFQRRIEPRLVDLRSGELLEDPPVDPATYDQRAARADPQTSHEAPTNAASVKRVPDLAKIYLVRDDGQIGQVVLPVEGLGLYGTLYGFLALDRDTTTIRGIAFYENRETPGLGGEVDNPEWRALWPGRKAFDQEGVPRIRLVKGNAGPPDEDPYRVDALSGATMTSRGVNNMLQFWLSEHGFGPFLERLREQGSI